MTFASYFPALYLLPIIVSSSSSLTVSRIDCFEFVKQRVPFGSRFLTFALKGEANKVTTILLLCGVQCF